MSVVVPLRFVPPRELWKCGIADFPERCSHWYGSLRLTQNFYDANMRVIYVPYISLPRPHFEYQDLELMNRLLFRKIVRLIEDDIPDIVRCHLINPGIVLASNIAKYFQVPYVLDHHETLEALRERQGKHYLKMLAMIQKADLVLVHSEMNRTALVSEFQRNNLSAVKVEKVYLGQGFDTSERDHRDGSDTLNILTISNFTDPGKNIDVLIRAMAIVRKEVTTGLRLYLVGEGVSRKYFEGLASDLGLGELIVFAGFQSHEELKPYFGRSDIFVSPSRIDSFGLVVPEALANGLPVIGCKGTGAVEEIVPLGDCILPVEPSSVPKLAAAIMELARDPERRKRMGEIGRQIAGKYFTWDQSARTTSEIMVRMVQERRESHKEVKTQCVA